MYRSTALITVFFLALILQGCAAPIMVAGAGAGGYYVGKDDRKFETIVDDGSITSSINSKYLTTKGINTFDIDVDTHNGVVTLSGTVPNKGMREKAENIARHTDGVKKVINKLKVGKKK